MEIGRELLVVIGLLATSFLWVTAVALHRFSWSAALAGVRNGLLISLILGGVAGLLIYAVVSSLSGAFWIAVSMGFVIGVGFLWLGLTLMPIGFLARGGRDWARYGTWAAVGVVVVSIGLGWTAYSAYLQEQPDAQRPTPAPTGLLRPLSISSSATSGVSRVPAFPLVPEFP